MARGGGIGDPVFVDGNYVDIAGAVGTPYPSVEQICAPHKAKPS
jgi:hypothetical protein